MNIKESEAFLYFTNNYPPAIALVFVRLYHWGHLEWKGHKSGDWFYKSIKEISEDLGLGMKTIQRAYEIIKEGKCNLFISEVRMKGNYPVTWFKVIEKESELSTIYNSQKDYSEELTIAKMAMVPQSKRLRYYSQNGQGINIITHNNNSMYTETPIAKKEEEEESMKTKTDDLLKMIEIWNGLIRPSELETLPPSREKTCQEVLTKHFNGDTEQWREHCTRISKSSFLMGDKFTLSLNWALKTEWIQKVRDGGYDDFETKENNFMPKAPLIQLPLITIEEVILTCQNEVDYKVKITLYEKLGPEAYATWIHRTGASFYTENGKINVNSCGKFIQDTIKTRFWKEVEKSYA